MKSLLLLLAVLVFSAGRSFSQNTADHKDNQYRVRFNALTAAQVEEAKTVLTKLTEASAISYNAADSTFALTTYRDLDKKVIAGKLQKHFLSVSYIVKSNEHPEPFPQMQHSGDTQADARLYEQQKTEWIRNNPEAYKKMLEGSK